VETFVVSIGAALKSALKMIVLRHRRTPSYGTAEKRAEVWTVEPIG
jgi:hypothetical protein